MSAPDPAPRTHHGLHFPAFRRWNGSVLKAVVKMRTERILEDQAPAESLLAPLAIQTISLSTCFDEHFAAFTEAVGGRGSVDYLVRTLQFVAKGHALTATCPIPREKFGPLVLTHEHEIVTSARGARIFDAFLASTIAVRPDEATPLLDAVIGFAPKDKRAPITARMAAIRSVTIVPEQNVTEHGLRDSRAPRSGPCPAVPVPAVPIPPQPPTAGGSSSTPSANGHGNHRPLPDSERAGVLAACSAILGKRDLDRDIRAKTKAIQAALMSLDAMATDPDEIAEFVRVVVYARTEARIAYLGARRTA